MAAAFEAIDLSGQQEDLRHRIEDARLKLNPNVGKPPPVTPPIASPPLGTESPPEGGGSAVTFSANQ